MPVELGEITVYSLKELSQGLKVTLLTLRKYIAEGKLRAQKVGATFFVTQRELERFLEGKGTAG